MPFFSNKSRLLWGFIILMSLVAIVFGSLNLNLSRQIISKSLTAQTAKVELPKQAATEAANKWAKRYVFYSNAVERCATYKKKVYGSDIDSQLKDLLWGAAVVASEYCWAVDTQPAPIPTAKSKTAKPKQKKAESQLK